MRTSEVRFNGNGYLDIDKKLLDYQENRQIEIKIEFSTLEPDGLILWQGKVNDPTINYISLAIKNGKVSISILKNNANFRTKNKNKAIYQF